MPDTKAESEAIALATPAEIGAAIRLAKGLAGISDVNPHAGFLARAVLSLSAPGAQYRAGMERAAAICEDRDTQLGRLAAIYNVRPKFGMCAVSEASNLAQMIRAELAALPASVETAPIAAQPELRWETHPHDSDIEICKLGDLEIGAITFYPRPKPVWGIELGASDVSVGQCGTKSEARITLEAAVRERLAALPAPTSEER